MTGAFAKATAIEGLPVPVAEIALPRAATPLLSGPGIEGFQWVRPDLFSPLAHARVCATPRTRSAINAISTTYGIDNTPLPYSQYNLADIGTRQRVRVCD